MAEHSNRRHKQSPMYYTRRHRDSDSVLSGALVIDGCVGHSGSLPRIMEQSPNFVDQIIRKYEEKEQLLEQRLLEM